jgi:4-amino-4-deoxy-L-arabinose transferase-like glycosyltransferase
VGAILIVLALGLTLRVIIAYQLPGSGFEVDLGAFRFWASDLATNGPLGFYDRDFFHDYTPGYLYVLWLVGLVGDAVGGIGDLIKVPPILADLAIGWLVWSMVRELGAGDRAALAGALVAVLNPISWFDSVVWGQVDSFGVVFLLLALRSLWRDQPERAAIFTVVAAIIKPQLGILVPLVAVVTIRRALWPVRDMAMVDTDADEAPGDGLEADIDATRGSGGLVDRLRAWERRTGSPLRILTTGLAGYLTAVLLSLPFGLSVIALSTQAPFVSSGLVDQIVVAGGGYPYLTVNAYNAWALVPGDLGHSLANAGLWVCDAIQTPADRCSAGVAAIGPVPAVMVGAVLLILALGVALWVAARHPDRLTLLVVLAVLALAFFAVPTRVHERYGFPFFALAAILFALSFRWRIAYVVLSVATFANMYVVLTTLYPDNPSIADWLGVGDAIRSQAGVVTVAVLHTLAFGWALLQLRTDARARLADDLAAATASPDAPGSSAEELEIGRGAGAPDDGASGAAIGTMASWDAASTPRGSTGQSIPGQADQTPSAAEASLPVWSAARPISEAGLGGWFRDRLGLRPARADRSGELVGERGGRFDRLDAWFLVVLVVATMGMRTFRLAEPYEMHFDEVYHARTATEFLQDWRYDLDHDIYEWTHPHLAKYVMAGGLVAWGGDQVRDTSMLDVPVVDAVIEPRRDDALTGERSGERIHVVTGSEVRTYDLRDRALVGTSRAPGATAIAIDSSTDQLIVGYADGGLATLDLAVIGLSGVDRSPEPVELGRVDHAVSHLLASDDGSTIIAASDSRLTVVDASTGLVLGSSDLPDIADLAPAGTGAAIVGVPDAIDDVGAVSEALADLTGGDALDYEDRLAAATDPAGQVVLGSPGSGDDRTAVEDAIGDGTLAGLEIVDLPRVGVATADGVTFVDPATAAETETLGMDGGAHGLAMVTGIDDPQLYVTAGAPADPAYEVVAVGGDDAADGPVTQGRHPLPGPGTKVAFDEASQMVHILGQVPGATGSAADGWTVYVVEPHGNAVFADAALPSTMTPTAWAMDVQKDRPATDRQELLVFGADGLTAAIDVGSHAFAWRLPGVIAGVLMAVCLYLLARILFRRRLVAGLVAAFVAIDGMLFVQSRIGMNDVYVGLFIMAAYAVFAAVWTGWWRGRAAFWISMPVIGLLLGLALASKWVAAYAIGALVLLLLIRSALGRVVAIVGLIAISSVLGYIAIAVPEGQGIGNITFLVIMVGLTARSPCR